MKQQIKIIGGRFKGRVVNFPETAEIRPTPNRVRETLFNWLMHDIKNACCLDAFAGSGALGFEAFSRGAARVVFVEQTRTVYHHLKREAQRFGSPELIIVHHEASTYLKQTNTPFDIIFLDPPFSQDQLIKCLPTLENSQVLRPHGLLYIESEKEMTLNPAHWKKLRLKETGQVTYGLYEKLPNH